MQCEEIREIRRELRDYLVSNFYVPDPLADSASLIRSGTLDSAGVQEMVAFLETTFGIHVADEEKQPENLDSIARAAAFVWRKKSSMHPVEEAADFAVDDVGMGYGSHVTDAVELEPLDLG